jgi:hypothetical protein
MVDTKPQVAFIAAVLVLLVMPIVFLSGLAVFAFIVPSTVGAKFDQEGSLLTLSVILVWGLLVMAGILVLVARFVRRSATSTR